MTGRVFRVAAAVCDVTVGVPRGEVVASVLRMIRTSEQLGPTGAGHSGNDGPHGALNLAGSARPEGADKEKVR